MRGRRPAGPAYVNHLSASEIARQRLLVILETMTRSCGVMEACVRLGVCTQRFHQLRQQAMEWALAGLEPGRPGRRPRQLSAAEKQIKALQEQIAALELELRVARARAEIALVLPNAVRSAEPAPKEQQPQEPTAEAEKKTRGRPRRIPAVSLG
jgi:hypothetical protein